MTADGDFEPFISAEQVCELMPGMTKPLLAQMRFRGDGPPFYKPTPKKVFYRKSDVIAWVEASRRSITEGRES